MYAEFDQLKLDSAALLKKIDSLPTLKSKRKNKIAGYSDYLSMEAIELDQKRKQVFKDFLTRIGSMKFLDPACGCGNFLLISYKELRKLENEVLAYINEGAFSDSYISINQFYGIEIEDWPSEIAHVSMWLMQHLMNQETNARFGSNIETIPLKSSATIATKNALTIDWNDILPAEECTYILGNPPFGGTTFTTADQKQWLKDCYPPKYKLGYADFSSAWFVKAAEYMQRNKNIQTAFVSTNSICQGEQVKIIWGLLFERGIKIDFAYSSFPWKNEAKDNAGVTCVIVGFSYKGTTKPVLTVYDNKTQSSLNIACEQISPYLTNCSKVVIIESQSQALSSPLNLVRGPQPTDGGNLIFEYSEGQSFLQKYPESKPFIKKFIGSSELMKSEFRYCLWLTEDLKNEWSKIQGIVDRVKKCEEWRALQTKTGAAYKFRNVPWRFGQLANPSNPESALVIPSTTGESRFYVPFDFIKSDTIVSNLAFMLPNATMYDFGVLSSRMHMTWMRLTSGRNNQSYRYSKDMSFNTFIWPKATEVQKEEIVKIAKDIRRIRARNIGTTTLGDLYNPETMPEDLREAHNNLDLAVEKAYRDKPFENDEERLSFLLALYSEAIAKKGAK